MKKIFLSAVAVVAMSCVAVYADNGKKTVAKKKAKTECCKKQSCCNTLNCPKSSCSKKTACLGN